MILQFFLFAQTNNVSDSTIEGKMDILDFIAKIYDSSLWPLIVLAILLIYKKEIERLIQGVSEIKAGSVTIRTKLYEHMAKTADAFKETHADTSGGGLKPKSASPNVIHNEKDALDKIIKDISLTNYQKVQSMTGQLIYRIKSKSELPDSDVIKALDQLEINKSISKEKKAGIKNLLELSKFIPKDITEQELQEIKNLFEKSFKF